MMNTESENLFVGIDLFKACLDVAVHPQNKRWSVANDEPGIDSLMASMKAMHPTFTEYALRSRVLKELRSYLRIGSINALFLKVEKYQGHRK